MGLTARSTTVTADVFAIVDPRRHRRRGHAGHPDAVAAVDGHRRTPTIEDVRRRPAAGQRQDDRPRLRQQRARDSRPARCRTSRAVVRVQRGHRRRRSPGSPRLPDQGPRTLTFGASGVVTDAERKTTNAAYTFTLPASWTGTNPGSTSQQDLDGQLARAARLHAEPDARGVRRRERASSNNTQTLNTTRFTATCCVNVATVDLRANELRARRTPISSDPAARRRRDPARAEDPGLPDADGRERRAQRRGLRPRSRTSAS